ncbi:MAG TPA: replication-relaxation family protein [Chloroflexia bacterium]|nr:replication-relaxation family protein [Chloroflexia bacterium]
MAQTLPPLPPLSRSLLRWIGDGGLATGDQLARRFWPPDGHARSPYVYLHRLEQQGYIRSRRHQVLGRVQPLYVLTAAASTALQIDPPFVRIDWPPPAEYEHLALAQETRLYLEQQLANSAGGAILAWRSDYLLRHLYPPTGTQEHIPDIQAKLCFGPRQRVETYQIEIDGGHYHGKMLARKVAQYGAQPHKVIWACRTHRAARIARAIQPYPNIQILALDLANARRQE